MAESTEEDPQAADRVSLTGDADGLGGALLIALRRITRAIDLHSRTLLREHQLTGPQLLVLRTVHRHGETSAGVVAREISLSQPTVTGILSRLEAKGLVHRRRSDEDRRKVLLRATPTAEAMLAMAPPLLQESFLRQFEALPAWEQMQILSSIQRVVAMMDADTIDAAPVLTTGPIDAPPPADDDR